MSEDDAPFEDDDIEEATVDGDDIAIAVEDDEGEVSVLDDVEEVEFEVAEDAHESHTPLPIREMEFEGSFEVEVEDAALFESLLAGELFESGLSMELADDLDDLITEDEATVPSPASFLEPDAPDVVESLEVDGEQAEKLLKVIYQKLNEYQEAYSTLPEQLVLGLPQFKAVEAYTQDQHSESAEQRLPVAEIVVVPGPQIHCVRDPYALVKESLTEEGEDGDSG